MEFHGKMHSSQSPAFSQIVFLNSSTNFSFFYNKVPLMTSKTITNACQLIKWNNKLVKFPSFATLNNEQSLFPSNFKSFAKQENLHQLFVYQTNLKFKHSNKCEFDHDSVLDHWNFKTQNKTFPLEL